MAIGVCAFANNERLREIEIPQSVVHFANNNPFGGCKSLNTIKMNSSNFVVDEGLIYSNDYRILYSALFVFNSSSVIFIDTRTEEISANCFWGQKGISTIVVPESVKLIGKAAFDKSDIRYLELKCPIETIPESFMSLSHCDHLSLPNSIKHIGSKAFFMSTFKELVVGEEFMWKSQNTDSHQGLGKRFVEQSKNKKKFLLFVRENKRDGFGNTCPFYCFGLIDYISSYDDQPMSIDWRMHQPILPQFIKAV